MLFAIVESETLTVCLPMADECGHSRGEMQDSYNRAGTQRFDEIVSRNHDTYVHLEAYEVTSRTASKKQVLQV